MKELSGFWYGSEVYDTEIYGATVASLAALSAKQNEARISVLLDNQAVIGALRTGKTSFCLRLTRIFHEVACKANVEIRWVPGHSKISGNEEADTEARAALELLPARDTPHSYIILAYLRRLMHLRRQKLLDNWWSMACPVRNQDLDLKMRHRKPP